MMFVLSGGTSSGQVNEYFNHNPVWQVHSQCGVPAPCIKDETYNYYLNGDTVINGLVYKQIFRKGTGYYNWFSSPPPSPGCSGSYSFVDSLPTCFLRSDNKKMFVIPVTDTVEQLLYDFDLAIGDSLPLSYNNIDPAVIVTAIDSLYTPYGYRKKFTLTGNTWSQELLEGIGHSSGLMEYINVMFDCGFNLLCYSLNDTAWYPANGPTCMMNVGLTELEQSLSAVNIYPNPFQNSTTLTLGVFLNSGNLVIYNLQGMKVREVTGLLGNQVVIERGSLQNGIYFYELKNDDLVVGKGKLLIKD